MAFNLRVRGHDVLTVEDGLGAVRKARQCQPDLIVLDVMLNSLDGYTVCEILRSQLSTKAIPVIIVTAASGQRARIQALAAGADDFMSKPFSPRDLVTRIEDTLQRCEEQKRELRVEEEPG